MGDSNYVRRACAVAQPFLGSLVDDKFSVINNPPMEKQKAARLKNEALFLKQGTCKVKYSFHLWAIEILRSFIYRIHNRRNAVFCCVCLFRLHGLPKILVPTQTIRVFPTTLLSCLSNHFGNDGVSSHAHKFKHEILITSKLFSSACSTSFPSSSSKVLHESTRIFIFEKRHNVKNAVELFNHMKIYIGIIRNDGACRHARPRHG